MQTDIGADGFLGDEAARRQSMPAWLSAGGKGHSERKVRRTGANLALVIHNSAWAEPHYLPIQNIYYLLKTITCKFFGALSECRNQPKFILFP
ncbi:hypothetical protein ACQ0NY_000349 [Pseudomonas aeruginosa]